MVEQRALTIKGNNVGLLRAIVCDVLVSTPFFEGIQNSTFPSIKVQGLWDTGATGSVITKRVADNLGIKPIGRTKVNHADGSTETNVYLVNIVLPSNVTINGVRVTEGKLTEVDVLIGMDVIRLGDFSITNFNGNTVATFRTPSCHEIDYVKIINDHNQRQQIKKYLPQPKHKHRKR